MHLLVVANETVDARTLREALAARDGEVWVTVVAPVNQPPRGYVVYADTHAKFSAFANRPTPGAIKPCLEDWWGDHNWEGYFE